MEKIKVLITDDHAIVRDGVKALLGIQGDLEVIGEAIDGKDAITKAEELVPDVIVMDIVMPGMDGIEATRRINKDNPEIKILMLTQHDNREYVLSAVKAGAKGYVPKKALGSELVTAIRTVYTGDSFLYPSTAATLIDDYRKRTEDHEPYARLTTREREILRLIASGKTSRQIADMLFISLKTVHGHRAKVMKELNIHNRADLIKYALRKGLVHIDN